MPGTNGAVPISECALSALSSAPSYHQLSPCAALLSVARRSDYHQLSPCAALLSVARRSDRDRPVEQLSAAHGGGQPVQLPPVRSNAASSATSSPGGGGLFGLMRKGMTAAQSAAERAPGYDGHEG